MGTGIGHYIPLVAYLGFWVLSIYALAGKPLYGLYYMLPFLPYRTMRDHFLDYPLGANVLTILVVAVILGALIHGKHLPKSKLYLVWLVFGVYLYFSMWIGVALANAPAPLWITDINFTTWKDYMVIPLVFVATGLVVEDRKSVRMVVLITAVTLLLIDRVCIIESMSRTWTSFDEQKRDPGPLAYGSNQTSAFLAQFAMFFWGFTQFVKKKKFKILGYVLVALTIFANLYTFSRGGYLAILFAVLILGLLKDRKMILILGAFLLTWQTIVPAPVRERVNMTQSADGQLEASAQERVELWENAERAFFRSPIVGNGYATFQMGDHVDDLKDTHNWYVKVLVETGVVGLLIAIWLLQQMYAVAYKLFKRATDPLYRGLGLGLILGLSSCVVANCFGDRWTYLEIMGLMWALFGAAARAYDLSIAGEATEAGQAHAKLTNNPYLSYR